MMLLRLLLLVVLAVDNVGRVCARDERVDGGRVECSIEAGELVSSLSFSIECFLFISLFFLSFPFRGLVL